eukprot:CAMPEP_0196770884 /NCGR_PEP_ID=MMETSP1104-20130614/1386_1 /TAXON_ID=33652 /ORGANISM="Cafeteria sp., Strain Caron Lab Isolate" /LENGTH=278 /DNA_ID=CAMNT_0042140999 /DNA_START=584 /DNA_END=1417 /DNA_ORIENTATION=-
MSKTTTGVPVEELSDYGSEDEDEDFVLEEGADDGERRTTRSKKKEQRPRRGAVGGASEASEPSVSVAMTAAERRRKNKASSLFEEMQQESLKELGVKPKKVRTQASKAASGSEGSKKGKPQKRKVKRDKKGLLEFNMPDLAPAKRSKKASDGMTEVKEVVKFAGRTMELTKKVAADSKEAEEYQRRIARERAWNSGRRGGEQVLDKLLTTLKGDRSVSTIEKSSYDWEKYKDDQGVREEVEAFTKDGYVAKQEFLQRVDYRQFEKERDERNRQRAARE